MDFDLELARWFESELGIEYSAKEDTPERYRDRLLLQKTLHYANCYFFSSSGQSLLETTKETKDKDGPFWNEIHLSLKKKAPRDEAFDTFSFVPTLRIIAEFCKAKGGEQLKKETYKCETIRKAKEGDTLLVEDLHFPATPFEEAFVQTISSQLTTFLENDPGPQYELKEEDWNFEFPEFVY